jgi:hypothetical protein
MPEEKTETVRRFGVTRKRVKYQLKQVKNQVVVVVVLLLQITNKTFEAVV